MRVTKVTLFNFYCGLIIILLLIIKLLSGSDFQRRSSCALHVKHATSQQLCHQPPLRD